MSKGKVFLVAGITILILFLLIVLPALTRVRINYHYVHSLSNLKWIGLGFLMYAEDHNDAFPDNLELLKEYIKDPDVFESRLKPKDFNGPSYIYISGHSYKDTKSKEKYIIVYENPEYLTGYDFEQVNVVYLDGNVERLKKEDFLSKLRKTYEHLGKPMPEIKFKEQLPVTETK
jgi:hypothetical protein